MSKEIIKDFTDRLKGVLGKMYNSYKDSEVSNIDAGLTDIAEYWNGKATATREAIMLLERVAKEFTEK